MKFFPKILEKIFTFFSISNVLKTLSISALEPESPNLAVDNLRNSPNSMPSGC
jgi:hypothetical protein